MPTTRPIHLHLNDIQELFAEPAADPFDPETRYLSGMEELWARLHEIKPRERDEVSVSISLPADKIELGLEAQTRLALQRYGEAQMRACQSELAQIRLKAPRQLIYSIVIVLLGTTLGALILASQLLPAALNTMLASGLSIFAWVALWQPAQIYIYDWIPLVSDKRLYGMLREIPLEIRADKSLLERS
jgi:hypothetical protein